MRIAIFALVMASFASVANAQAIFSDTLKEAFDKIAVQASLNAEDKCAGVAFSDLFDCEVCISNSCGSSLEELSGIFTYSTISNLRYSCIDRASWICNGFSWDFVPYSDPRRLDADGDAPRDYSDPKVAK